MLHYRIAKVTYFYLFHF